jgi:hypothetical protein
VPDQADTSPPERAPASAPEPAADPAPGGAGVPEHKRRRRVLVWSMIVVASVLLVFSITANWVQRAVLDTDEVANTSDEILSDQDVQEALSIYLVDQLYANVDVQGQIEEKLPDNAKALAAPVAAATRQLALNVSEKALASPRVQELVSQSIRVSHGQFVRLIEDEGEFVSTTGGAVTLQYGDVIADLATRLGVDPATISNIRSVVQDLSQDLKQRLTTTQTRIKTVRAALADVQGGTLSPELEQNLQALQTNTEELQAKIAALDSKLEGVQGKAPAQLQDRLAKLDERLSDLDGRLTTVADRTTAVLEDPEQANVDGLDAALASAQARVTAALDRQALQNPGQLVVLKSGQLDGVQTLVGALRNLGFALPLLVLLLYMAAIYLATGWRRQALIAAGGGILAATLLVLLTRRLLGGAVVDSVAGSETVKPAIQSVWDVVSGALRERALFALVIGLAFVGAGLLAGPGRYAVAARRGLAPHLRDHRVAVYFAVAVLFLLWLTVMPGLNNLGQVLVILLLAVLAVVGIEVLRRQTAHEFPPHPNRS